MLLNSLCNRETCNAMYCSSTLYRKTCNVTELSIVRETCNIAELSTE